MRRAIALDGAPTAAKSAAAIALVVVFVTVIVLVLVCVCIVFACGEQVPLDLCRRLTCGLCCRQRKPRELEQARVRAHGYGGPCPPIYLNGSNYPPPRAVPYTPYEPYNDREYDDREYDDRYDDRKYEAPPDEEPYDDAYDEPYDEPYNEPYDEPYDDTYEEPYDDAAEATKAVDCRDLQHPHQSWPTVV